MVHSKDEVLTNPSSSGGTSVDALAQALTSSGDGRSSTTTTTTITITTTTPTVATIIAPGTVITPPAVHPAATSGVTLSPPVAPPLATSSSPPITSPVTTTTLLATIPQMVASGQTAAAGPSYAQPTAHTATSPGNPAYPGSLPPLAGGLPVTHPHTIPQPAPAATPPPWNANHQNRWYIVTVGRSVGVFSKSEVAPLVTGVPKACYHRCESYADAQQEFEQAITAGGVRVV